MDINMTVNEFITHLYKNVWIYIISERKFREYRRTEEDAEYDDNDFYSDKIPELIMNLKKDFPFHSAFNEIVGIIDLNIRPVLVEFVAWYSALENKTGSDIYNMMFRYGLHLKPLDDLIKIVKNTNIPTIVEKIEIKNNPTQIDTIAENKKRIFISHSSLDEKIVNDFVNIILQNGLGINPIQDVFCTSVEGLKIQSGEDFRISIKQNIISTDIVVLLLSENYKKSEICLNEMGACWVLSKRVIPIIVPPINYTTVGAIAEPLQCLNLFTDSDINQLCDELIADLKIELKDIKLSRLDSMKKEFLNKYKTT
jgi:hypothetical protein